MHQLTGLVCDVGLVSTANHTRVTVGPLRFAQLETDFEKLGALMTNIRTARLNLRLTPAELALIRWAAQEQRLAVTAFVVGAATARGQEVVNAARHT